MFDGTFPPLRDFQVSAHESLRSGARAGHKRQVIMAPTGAGKTILALNICKEATARGKRALFLCDRKTLIHQTSNVAESVGLWNHGIIQASNPKLDLNRPLQIASAQTLMRRGWPENMDVIVIDECHTQHKIWTEYVQSDECTAMVIGLSATPFSAGLGSIFSNLINAATMSALTDLGILVPMRVFSCRKPDMEGAKTSGGEWTDKAAEERELVIVGDVILEWGKHAQGLKTIVFGATIKHCEELCKQFNEAGITAQLFTSETDDVTRAAILNEFKKPDSSIRVLISVEALAKGFDVQDIECICDCRPLRKSLSTAIQMWGRGLRSSLDTGKKECRLLDFSGNIIRFRDDFSDIFFNGLAALDMGAKLDKEVRKDEEKEPKPCPKCGAEAMGKKCIVCGYERERKSMVAHAGGDMVEIVINGKHQTLASDKIDLYCQLATYAKLHAKPGGNPSGRAAHLYRDIIGAWPHKSLNIESAPWTEPSRATLNKIKSLAIAFSRRRP